MVREMGSTVGRLIGNHTWPVRSKSKGKKHEMRPIDTGHSFGAILTLNGSNDVIPQPLVPFGGHINIAPY